MSVHINFGTRKNGVAKELAGLHEHGMPPPYMFLDQVHGNIVVTIDDLNVAQTHQADAMVTRLKKLGLAIKTADCAPVLLYDEAADVIGAAHSGWQGTLLDIITPTIAAMMASGAHSSRIKAHIGPCLQTENFLIGDETRQKFLAKNAKYVDFFTPMTGENGRYVFDHAALIIQQLKICGVTDIAMDEVCTLDQSSQYYSHRARHTDTLHEIMRNVSVIWQD